MAKRMSMEQARLRRDEWFESQGNRCAKCGATEDLTIDHIDPRTKSERLRARGGGMRRVFTWPRQAMEAELAKCQILCVTCHREKTHVENLVARFDQKFVERLV